MLSLLLCLPLSLPPGDDLKKELQPLEGTWEATAWVADGKDTIGAIKITLEVKGEVFTWRFGDTPIVNTVSLHGVAGKPKLIDLTRPNDRQTMRGIYKLEGDKLTLCTSHTDRRPVDFAAPPGSTNLLRVMKRVKPKEAPGAPTGRPAPKPPAG